MWYHQLEVMSDKCWMLTVTNFPALPEFFVVFRKGSFWHRNEYPESFNISAEKRAINSTNSNGHLNWSVTGVPLVWSLPGSQNIGWGISFPSLGLIPWNTNQTYMISLILYAVQIKLFPNWEVHSSLDVWKCFLKIDLLKLWKHKHLIIFQGTLLRWDKGLSEHYS